MDVYVLVATFIDGWEDEDTIVVGVYTKLEDAINAGDEIWKNKQETFYSALICRRHLGETSDDYKFDLALRCWNSGKWEEVNYER